MPFDIICTVLSGSVISFISFLLSYVKDKTDAKAIDKENAEIKEKLENFKEFTNEHANVIDLMLKNVSELREYYVISKNQATKSFSAALTICFLGIVIYSFGIISVIFFNKEATLITIISGTVVEVISGLFFWLYREATNQLSIYHQRLGSTEKYLTVIQIIKEMPKEEQTEAFRNLTMAILTDNREIISREK